MDAQAQMKAVDNIVTGIIKDLVQLTKIGILSVEDSVKIIRILNDSQADWMEKSFNHSEIVKFVDNE